MDDRDRKTWAQFVRHFTAIEREVPKAPGLREPAARPSVAAMTSAVLAVVAMAAVALIVAVSFGPRSSRPAAVGGSPAASDVASPTPIGGESRLAGVNVTCDTPPVRPTPPPGLTCERAIQAALAILPGGDISSIVFGYGGVYCPPWARCALVPPTRAGVLVTWTDGSQPTVVRFAMDESGNLTAGRPEPAPTAISENQAIELAGQHTTFTTLVSVKAGLFADVNTEPGIGAGYPIKPGELVWAVTFSGETTVCPPAGACWSPRPGTVTVFLDYATGAFRASQALSPAK